MSFIRVKYNFFRIFYCLRELRLRVVMVPQEKYFIIIQFLIDLYCHKKKKPIMISSYLYLKSY